jgi:CSLREA domain-containing protein
MFKPHDTAPHRTSSFSNLRFNRVALKSSLLLLLLLALAAAAALFVSVSGLAREKKDVRGSGESVSASSALRHASLAATITVNSVSDTVNGSDNRCTLREAIISANTDTTSGAAVGECVAGSGTDTINFSTAITGTITLTGTELTISSDVSINGPGAHKLVVSGNNASRVFQITSGTVTINGLTISHGTNSINGGGGIFNDGMLTVNNCTISYNSAPGNANGGGILSTGTLTINSSTISHNWTGEDGGGIRQSTASATINNSTISGNSAGDIGGGIHLRSIVLVNNSTISDNRAATSGGGINRGSGTATLHNSIVAENFRGTGTTRDDLTGTFDAASSFNLVGDGTFIVTGPTNGTNGNQVGASGSSINPLLGPLQYNGGATETHALLTGSPAIDKGNSTLTPEQRGLTRPFDDPAISNATGGNGADIGALELQSGENLLVNSLADTDDGVCDANCTLREAIAAANASATHNAIYFNVTGIIFRAGGQLVIDSDVTINGPGARSLIVRGGSTSRVVQINSGRTASIYGLTISGGAAIGEGGAGIFNLGTLAIGNSIISDNTGGGILNSGILSITSSTISDNATSDHGGGIANVFLLFISNSTISGNRAELGGGIFNPAGIIGARATLLNTTVTNNHADVDNSGDGYGGGLLIDTSGNNVVMHNSIVAGNFKGSGSTTLDDFGAPASSMDTRSSFNLVGIIGGVTGITDGTNGNQLGTSASPKNPLLSPLQFNGGATPTHTLLTGSPAIDKGNTALSSDQRGLPRPVDIATVANAAGGNASDIGAVEMTASQNLVVNSLADTNDNVCNAANCTLREAVNAANADADFNLITFTVTGTITLSGTELPLNNNMAINGPGANLLTISGNNASRVFGVAINRVVALSDLTITNGNVSNNGGGIQVSVGAHLSVNNCTISGNQAVLTGGGISSLGTTLLINNSIISGNSAGQGGGISTGINSSKAVINNSAVSGNSASDFFGGGGIHNLSPGNLTAVNSTISGNSANADGGGINNSGTLTLTNVTVAFNRADADNSGGGVGGGIRSGAAGLDTLRNTIVAGNFRGPGSSARDDITGALNSASSFNLIGDGTNMTGLTNGTNNNQVGTSANLIDPRLGPLANNGGPTQTHALLPGSPALDAGSNSLAIGITDQRGPWLPAPRRRPRCRFVSDR